MVGAVGYLVNRGALEITVGSAVGIIDGTLEGATVGPSEGVLDGLTLGTREGLIEGFALGIAEGDTVGLGVGSTVSGYTITVGPQVGTLDGTP